MNTFPSLLSLAVLAVTLGAGPSRAADPRPFRVAPVLMDAVELPSPAAMHLDGFMGGRIAVNEQNRLVKVDLEPLLAGFRQKPGTHPWIGEHIGKWMHASTLAWANTGDPELRRKLDYAAAELVKAQEPNGYLGTYVPEKRFGLYEGADWDVWSHKYNLIGLLTYYQYTGHEPALQACRKMGDLLIQTFGPGRKSIISAGTHVGMASTSVLEPVVILYRCTGDERYLDFARYLVNAWDEPNGPRILKTLLTEKSVQKTANGKAYEMLSNLVGLCELARVTGNQDYIQACRNAWEDITAHRLYLTGSASQGEHFREDFYLPNGPGSNMAETCVTTTWIQFNSQLLRLTGEARFADELERTFYNHLGAAQRPDGAQWCYYTSLEGRKPYGPGINCCVSSGPRGMSLVPQHAWLRVRDGETLGIALNLYDSSRLAMAMDDVPVTFDWRSGFPRQGEGRLTLDMPQPTRFTLRLREPAWASPVGADVNGQAVRLERDGRGWMTLPNRVWKSGDTVTLRFGLEGRMVRGDHGNRDKAALMWGPIVLAYDDGRNLGLPKSQAIGLAAPSGDRLLSIKEGAGDLAFTAAIRAANSSERIQATFVPFADAGRDGSGYRVWLRAPGVPLAQNSSILSAGQEGRSREGNVDGSINDGDPSSCVVTFNGTRADEDWFAVSLDEPATLSRVEFVSGKIFHDGGWFDASAGKPRIQVQRTRNGPWETVGELSSYPETTATNPAGLKEAKSFTLRLQPAVKALAVRAVGKPASGDNPRQAFSSCGELMAFGE